MAKRPQNNTSIVMEENNFWRSKLDVISLIIIVLTIWIPRVLELNRFATPDEHLWLSRSANFYYALGQRDFASTYQMYHPGVTTMWAGTAGFLARFPEYRGGGVGQLNPEKFNYYLTSVVNVPPIDILVAARFFIVLAHTFILVIAYLYARRLIGPLPSFLAFLLIAFNPFHLALSRVLHLDALLSNLLLLSLFAFLSYLNQRHLKDLIISGIAAGFGWLTKSPAFLIIPVIFILMRIDSLRSLSLSKERSLLYQLKRLDFPLILWGTVGVIVFVVFWPAMWVNPIKSMTDILISVGISAESGHEWPVFFNGNVAEDGNLGLNYFYFYPLTYLWRSTPVVLAGLLAAVIGYVRKWNPFTERSVKLTLLGICLFVVVFTIGITLIGKKFDRYFLPAYAPFDIISALGWVALVNWIRKRKLPRLVKIGALVFLVIIIGSQILPAIQTFPYYFTYYNPLMGGTKKAPEVMLIGWGEGLDQAARYLNEKENAENLHVTSWYSLGVFSYFFKGHSRNLHPGTTLNTNEWKSFNSSDYAVIYVYQWQRKFPKPVVDYITNHTPEHTIWINGMEYARIFKIQNVSQ